MCSQRNLPVFFFAGDSDALKAAEEIARAILGDLKLEFGTKEPSMAVQVRKDADAAAGTCLGAGAARRLLSLLELLPHGVVKISHDVEGLVRNSFQFVLRRPCLGGGLVSGSETFLPWCVVPKGVPCVSFRRGGGRCLVFLFHGCATNGANMRRNERSSTLLEVFELSIS